MTNIPDDIMIVTLKVVVEDLGVDYPGVLQNSYIECIAEAIIAERERCHQLMREVQSKARAKALEDAATIASTGTFHGVFQTSGDRRCAEDIAYRIRALQSEER